MYSIHALILLNQTSILLLLLFTITLQTPANLFIVYIQTPASNSCWSLCVLFAVVVK